MSRMFVPLVAVLYVVLLTTVLFHLVSSRLVLPMAADLAKPERPRGTFAVTSTVVPAE